MTGPWRTPFRLNLRAPAVVAPPAPAADAAELGDEPDEIASPMPGKVLRVLVAPGDRVDARAQLVVVEAMKMEMPLTAPRAGTVRAVHAAEGDSIERGAVLVELED